MCLKFTSLGCYTANMYETKIHDIDDLWKCLTQTCFNFDRNIIDAGVTTWDHVHAGGGHLEYMLGHECSLPAALRAAQAAGI